jgi:hypothetical protein
MKYGRGMRELLPRLKGESEPTSRLGAIEPIAAIALPGLCCAMKLVRAHESG